MLKFFYLHQNVHRNLFFKASYFLFVLIISGVIFERILMLFYVFFATKIRTILFSNFKLISLQTISLLLLFSFSNFTVIVSNSTNRSYLSMLRPQKAGTKGAKGNDNSNKKKKNNTLKKKKQKEKSSKVIQQQLNPAINSKSTSSTGNNDNNNDNTSNSNDEQQAQKLDPISNALILISFAHPTTTVNPTNVIPTLPIDPISNRKMVFKICTNQHKC